MLDFYHSLQPDTQVLLAVAAIMYFVSLHVFVKFMSDMDLSGFPRWTISMAHLVLWPLAIVSVIGMFILPLSVILFWVGSFFIYGVVSGGLQLLAKIF